MTSTLGRKAVLALLLAASLVAGGALCYRWYRPAATTPSPEAAEPEKKERPKPPVEVVRLGPSLCEPGLGCYKPGHWTDVLLEARANQSDFRGDLHLTVVDPNGEPQGLAGTQFDLTSSRPLALPKGPSKQIQMPLFFPLAATRGWIDCRGEPRQMGFEFQRRELLVPMPAYQYYCVVLARQPDRYVYWAHLRSFDPSQDSLASGSILPVFRVVRFRSDTRPPLPSQSLFWTSIAAIVWDDVPPESLSPEQQQALLDWLHWGGRLIVSGPNSLDLLRHSFLAPYLPALAAGQRNLHEAELAPLANLAGATPRFGRPQPPRSPRPWPGVKLALEPEGQYIDGSGQLMAERRVGQGRILATAFHLDDRQWVHWVEQGADQVISGTILPFPWSPPADEVVQRRAPVRRDNTGPPPGAVPPGMVSQVRYFSRDSGSAAGVYLPPQELTPGYATSLETPADDDERPGTGVAAWNDSSEVARDARRTLANAARVKVPDRRFVVSVVALYLLVLVPVNWLFFRLLGHVEWAWAAAPLIALVCAAVVIHLAQLDIGFVRLQTEVAVLEAHGGYPRAHLTRYMALYSSLTTQYDFHFPGDPGALLQPFPKIDQVQNYSHGQGETRWHLHHRRDEDTTVSGFLVASSSTGMVHSEQMIELGGEIALAWELGGRYRLVNHTRYTIDQANIARRISPAAFESAWIESLPPGGSALLEFSPCRLADNRDWAGLPQREQSPLTAQQQEQGAMNLHQLVALAETPAQLQPDEIRLVGLVREPVAGMEIHPAAAQTRAATLLLVHWTRLPAGNSPLGRAELNEP